MANYKETDLAGVSWVRCKNITITNPLDGTMQLGGLVPLVPTAYFQEEKVISIDGVQNTLDVGSCFKKFNPVEPITLVNPETGGPIGTTVSHEELYVILYSLYLQTAQERDLAAT